MGQFAITSRLIGLRRLILPSIVASKRLRQLILPSIVAGKRPLSSVLVGHSKENRKMYILEINEAEKDNN
jgi:hypothetical protein